MAEVDKNEKLSNNQTREQPIPCEKLNTESTSTDDEQKSQPSTVIPLEKIAAESMSEVHNKDLGGQPTKYKLEYCQQLIDYFDIEPYEEIPIEHFHEDGKTVKWIDKKRVPARLPTLRRFAKSINVHISTIYNWLNEKHDSFQREFLDAFTHAQEIRKEFLNENALQGMYQPQTFKFIAVNITDMRDRTATEITGAGGAPIPLQIVNFADALKQMPISSIPKHNDIGTKPK